MLCLKISSVPKSIALYKLGLSGGRAELKCTFDLFDHDYTGSASLQAVIHTFKAFGVDLTEEIPVEQGGYGVGSSSAFNTLRRNITTHSSTKASGSDTTPEYSLRQFVRMMLIDRANVSIEREISALLEQIPQHRDSEGDFVWVSDLNSVLEFLGTDVDGLSQLDNSLREAATDGSVSYSSLENGKIRTNDLVTLGVNFSQQLARERATTS